MGHSRVYLKVTTELLAELSGKSVCTVLRHIRKGIFDPSDWESLQGWLLKYGKQDKEKGGSG